MALHQISADMLRRYKKRHLRNIRTVPQMSKTSSAAAKAARPHKPGKGFIACSVCTVVAPKRGYGCSAKRYFYNIIFRTCCQSSIEYKQKSARSHPDAIVSDRSDDIAVKCKSFDHRTAIIDRYGCFQPVVIAGNCRIITVQRKFAIITAHRSQRPGL